MTVDYWKLNKVVAPITVVVDVELLLEQINKALGVWNAAILISQEDQVQFALT